MQCPVCAAAASGSFCSSCGASLRTSGCIHCGTSLVPGARFCTQCGAATAAAPGDAPPGAAPARANLVPWYAGGAVLLAIAAVLALPLLSSGDAETTAVRAPLNARGAQGTAPPPLTGTPREQADRLFNRIMQAHASGDSASVTFFLPMGIQAYQLASPLDDDGLYHLAMLHAVAGDAAAALDAAGRILEHSPDHLLALAVAGEAAEGAGDVEAARRYYGRLLAVYADEIERGLPEYEDHAAILPEYLGAAQRVTGR
ncbi:MAG: zinc ribbon domain-containing protein [Gemmatimonadota bacterium]